MAEYQIITDSTTDISAEMIQELGVHVIPLSYMIEGRAYRNVPSGGEMTIQEFYGKLREGKLSTTAQVNVEEFIGQFTPFLEAGKDILYLAFSSGLSGTFQSAKIAKEDLLEKFPERRIEVFDTLCASMGEGLLLYHAAMRQKEGQSMESVLSWLDQNALRLCHWFTVDDLFHLKRGGRVSAATALVGTALGIKPVLHVDDEGHLIKVSQTRGRKKSLDALVDHMVETALPGEQPVFISHGDCLEDAQYVAEQVKERTGLSDIHINFIGPVIGAHSGPGTVALFFLGSKR